MTVRIKKFSDSLYTADLILPDMAGITTPWSTPEPMRADQVVEELRSRGAHPTDIGDAFYEADPHWLTAFGIGSSAKACICREVLDGSQLIQIVSRTKNDWRFLCAADHPEDGSEQTIVAVSYVVKSDRTLLALHDLPIGWKAVRESLTSPWIRSPLD